MAVKVKNNKAAVKSALSILRLILSRWRIYLLTFRRLDLGKIDFKADFLPVERKSVFLSGHKFVKTLTTKLLICYIIGSLNLYKGKIK